MDSKKIEKQKHCFMDTFLRAYVGITDEDVIERLSCLTHKQFKEVYDKLEEINLVRIPFEAVTQEAIETGEVLLVLDRKNNTAPYINPVMADFDVVMEDEIERQAAIMYDAKRHVQTFDEYVDTLDDVALDKGTSHQKIKVLGCQKTIERVNNND